MDIITKYGIIDSNNYEGDDETTEFIDGQVESAILFFVSELELDLDDVDSDIVDGIIDIIIGNKFTMPERALAILEITDHKLEDLEEDEYGKGKLFAHNSDEEYVVLTEEEADEETVTNIENTLDDLGMFDLFSKDLQETILMQDELFNTLWFDEYMKEDSYNYIEDIETESMVDEPTDDEYLHRLHEELCNESILDEPEYPEFPDEDDERYEEAYDKYIDYMDELKDKIEEAKDSYAEMRIGMYDSGIEWYRDNFGDESLKEVIQSQDLVDNEKIAKWVYENDYTNRGNEIARYDGEELEARVEYKGEDYWFYIYRTN